VARGPGGALKPVAFGGMEASERGGSGLPHAGARGAGGHGAGRHGAGGRGVGGLGVGGPGGRGVFGRSMSLGAWLSLLSFALVLLVLAALVPTGLGSFERLATENARNRVQLAVLGAVEGLQRYAEEALVDARLLAERPTLLRLTGSGEVEALGAFLAQFGATDQLDGCAVVLDGAVVAAQPQQLPWAAIAADTGDGLCTLAGLDATTPPLVVASVALAGQPQGRALTVLALDEALLAALAGQVGLHVGLERAHAEPAVSAVLEEGAWRARRPLDLPGLGGGFALVASLPSDSVQEALRPLERTFTLVTLAAGVLALTTGVFAARRLARPFHALQLAAQRIGSGDLATPVPRTRGAEAAALGSTMEEMRLQLRALANTLQHREAEAKSLLEGIMEGVFAVDRERRIQYLNPQAAARLGLDVDQAIGRFCGDVLRPAEVQGQRPCETSCPILHARSRGSSRAVERLQLGGGVRTVVITSAPPVGGRQVQLLRDETEIESARRSRDAVLANVTHELRTPLSAQLASIELLRDALGPEVARSAADLVDALERSTLRLTRLIDNLLESVRIETGQGAFRPVPVDLVAVVEEATALTLPLLTQRRQALTVELPEGLAGVSGAPAQLTQVLVNLLANANKYAPEGSPIHIGGASDASEVALWVEDRGPGVPAGDSRSVFDRFHRLDEGADGMGLGLFIVKSIVERHGGRVTVDEPPGGGARFTLTLPSSRQT